MVTFAKFGSDLQLSKSKKTESRVHAEIALEQEGKSSQLTRLRALRLAKEVADKNPKQRK